MFFSLEPLIFFSEKNILDKSRASAHTGVGIPRLNGNAYRNASKKLGDCHTSDIGHWFAMTVFFLFVLFDETNF